MYWVQSQIQHACSSSVYGSRGESGWYGKEHDKQGGDDAAVAAAVDAAITETGASSIKEMGRVMAALKARHGAGLDMAVAGPVVKARLGG